MRKIYLVSSRFFPELHFVWLRCQTKQVVLKGKKKRTKNGFMRSWSALWRLLFVNANVNHFASAFCLFSKSLMRFKLLCIVVVSWPTLLTLRLILVVLSVKEMTSDVYTTGRDAHLVQNNPLFIFAVLLTDLLWLFLHPQTPNHWNLMISFFMYISS